MRARFKLPSHSPLGAGVSEVGGLVPLRVPHGWNVVHNALWAARLPDGRIEVNDSEDLYWACTAPLPFLTDEERKERAGTGDLRCKEINIDAGWYTDSFRVVVLDPGWDEVRASHATSDFVSFVGTLETWMWEITCRGEFPES